MRTALALVLLVLTAAPARAQEVSIVAEVNRTAAALNEQLVLSVTVSGGRGDLPEPELPSMPNFSVYSSGRSQNISFINGQVASAIVYTYSLAPRFVGKAVIPPIAITVDGKRAETAPIEVQIVRPSQQAGSPASPTAPAPAAPRGAPPRGGFGPDVFVTASLDKQRARVNEQVTLTIRFHTAVTLLGNPEYVAPALNGFLSEDLPPERHGQMQSRGRLYHFSEIKTALFPAQAGKLSIGPATIRCQVQAEMAVDPFAPDFFQKFFSQGLLTAVTREIKTDPLTLTADPLPEGDKPDSFTGAVGQFRVTAGVDKRSVKVGDAVNLTVTVEGTGNLKALGPPKLPESSSFRAYDTVSSLNFNKANDVVSGSKAFKTVLVPRVSGTVSIPSIPFSYFDPSKGEYVRAGTAAIDLNVAPGTAAPGTSFVAPTAPGGDLTPVLEDIRYVKEDAADPLLARALGPLAARVWVHLAPLSVFLCSLGLALRRERLELDPAGARFRGAGAKALRLLQEAEAAAERDPGSAAARLAEALSGYVADKLGRSASGLTLREAQERLQARFPRLAPERLVRLKALWEEVDQIRFAGGGGGSAPALIQAVAEWVRALERELRK